MQTEQVLKKLLLLLLGIILIIVGIRGKTGSLLAVFITPEWVNPNDAKWTPPAG